MQKKISKDEVKRLCQTICEEIGEAYVGPFTLEMDSNAHSMILSLRGEKKWYRAVESTGGLEILDNSGNFLGQVPGLHLPSCEKIDELSIESINPSCQEVVESDHFQEPESENRGDDLSRSGLRSSVVPDKGNAKKSPFSLKISPGLSSRQVLEIIRQDLSRNHDVFSTLNDRDGMIWLTIEIPSDKMPQMRLVITSQVAGKTDQPGGSGERVVIMRLFTRVIVPPEKRSEILEKLNSYHNRSWAGCFRIHEDNEIEASWAQNLLEGGLFVDYIWDGIIRILTGWKTLFQDISV